MRQGKLDKTAYCGWIFDCLGPGAEEFRFFYGALLVDETGCIVACDTEQALDTDPALSDWRRTYQIETLPAEALLMPGLMDLHVHLPQLLVTGRQEDNLLTWLERHIYAEEARFADADYARRISRLFFEQLLKNGTTTACVFLTSHREAADIAFDTAQATGNRVVMGLNLMDANAPNSLVRPTEDLLRDTEALYHRWHNQAEGRLQYAWMPRFALTSSEELLKGIGELRCRYPDAYLHTHLSEQSGEIEAVHRQFPWAKDYTDVYDHFGLLGPKTILAHGIHLSDREVDCIQQHEAAIAHCPGSNFFLKSGRFRWFDLMGRNLRVGLGSDVGAGPTLSMLHAMRDAQYMQPAQTIAPNTLFFAATLGAARALHQEESLGNLQSGKQADFIVLDLASHPTLATVAEQARPEEILSTLIYTGDDRLVTRTYIAGRLCYQQTDLKVAR